MSLSRKHDATLRALFRRPVSGTIRWKDVEALFVALGADIEERAGSRVAVVFPGHMPAVFHRPHPSPMTDKGAVSTIRQWLERLGHTPGRG
ncbi:MULTISPECIES: type II toxin-antitoxin system HicA family toxin [unclassified Desulfovibrio]|uniref:type II toxin-antitoxin system HicA family toxin n=1 Tax=unclassified Desulfovibrio TaxID=2593640 RepID=UPI0021AB3CF1|nr:MULTISPECIES: type II toxin-antitoxin system HicA family toxin [unclassified Desulfovibrio]